MILFHCAGVYYQEHMIWLTRPYCYQLYTGCPITIDPPYLDYIGAYAMGNVFKAFWLYAIQFIWAILELLLTIGLVFMAISVWKLLNLFKVKKAVSWIDENFQVWPRQRYHNHNIKIKKCFHFITALNLLILVVVLLFNFT